MKLSANHTLTSCTRTVSSLLTYWTLAPELAKIISIPGVTAFSTTPPQKRVILREELEYSAKVRNYSIDIPPYASKPLILNREDATSHILQGIRIYKRNSTERSIPE
jgi:hypothetical protein